MECRIQGVFYSDPVSVVDAAWQEVLNSGIKPVDFGYADVYVLNRPNVGYAGGYSGQLQNFDHITLITEKSTNRVITAYPSGSTPPIPEDYKFYLEVNHELSISP